MAVKTTKIQCNQDVDLRGKVTCGGDAEIDGNLIVNSAANIKDKSLTSADAGKVLTVNEDGSIGWQQKGAGGGMKAYFDAGGKCQGSTATSFDNVISFGDTSDVTDMSYMFSGCQNLTSVPSLDTRNVTGMFHMFESCSSLTSVPSFDTSNVTSMSSMFSGCQSLTSVPSFDTRNVTNMSYMFESCSSLTSVPSFDTSNVTQMMSMFYNCKNLERIHMLNIGTYLNINSSTKFTREALLEIIGNLKTVTSTKTLTMGATNLAKLTEDDKAIATNKGWTLA